MANGTCARCGRDFSADEMASKNGKTKYAYCHACRLEVAAETRERCAYHFDLHGPLKPREGGVKKCSRCGEVRDVDEFGTRRGASDGLQGYCYECAREYAEEHKRRTARGEARS